MLNRCLNQRNSYVRFCLTSMRQNSRGGGGGGGGGVSVCVCVCVCVCVL